MSSAFLREAPFVRLVFPVILGIIFHHFSPHWNAQYALILALLCVAAYVLIYRITTARKVQLQPITGAIISILVAGFSIVNSHYQSSHNQPHYIQEGKGQLLYVRVLDDPKRKGKFYKTKAEVLSQNKTKAQGEIMAYLELSETIPHYGDEILIQTTLNKIEGPKNPYEFNYKQYLHHQGIDFQCFVSYKNWQVIQTKRGNVLCSLSYELKHHIERKMQQHFTSEKHIAMLKALLLGDKSDIDGDLKSGFTQTGTMHVMAVSGLHVGIVFAFMNGFVALFFRKKWQVVGVVFSLIALWFFALITGFSPSVNRACFMFSILAIGNQMNRSPSVYNSIACAAFFLLIINPNNIFNVGFQFSFLAVIGIVSLQKPLRNLIKTRNWFLSKLLDLTAVSVAAQLATLPLGLYYFGQFPVLFFLSNLLVIPAITVILYAGLCFILLSQIPIVAGIFAWLINGYLWFVLKTIDMFQSIPNTFIDNIFINRWEVILWALLVLAVSTILLGTQRKFAFPFALVVVIGLISIQSIRRFQNHTSAEIVQFDLGKRTCLFFRTGNVIHQLDKTRISDNDWKFHCKPYLMSRGVKPLYIRPINNTKWVSTVSLNDYTVNIDSIKNQQSTYYRLPILTK